MLDAYHDITKYIVPPHPSIVKNLEKNLQVHFKLHGKQDM